MTHWITQKMWNEINYTRSKWIISEKKNRKQEIGNANNDECETNRNIIISKEENKNSFTDIKKNQNNNMEINSIVTMNIKIIDNNENINSNSKKNKDNNDIIENSENIINKRNKI